MSKYCGKVGYITTIESPADSGIYVEVPCERVYRGDVVENGRALQSTQYLNDNVRVQNQISIIADAYAIQNYGRIRYVEWMGTMWKVDSVKVDRPRLLLTLGGVYNGQQTISAQ